MRNRLAILTIALAAAVAGAVLALSISLTVAQAPATSRATRTPDGKPNLNGIWQALNEANWDIEAHGAGASPFPQLLGALFAQPPGKGSSRAVRFRTLRRRWRGRRRTSKNG